MNDQTQPPSDPNVRNNEIMDQKLLPLQPSTSGTQSRQPAQDNELDSRQDCTSALESLSKLRQKLDEYKVASDAKLDGLVRNFQLCQELLKEEIKSQNQMFAESQKRLDNVEKNAADNQQRLGEMQKNDESNQKRFNEMQKNTEDIKQRLDKMERNAAVIQMRLDKIEENGVAAKVDVTEQVEKVNQQFHQFKREIRVEFRKVWTELGKNSGGHTGAEIRTGGSSNGNRAGSMRSVVMGRIFDGQRRISTRLNHHSAAKAVDYGTNTRGCLNDASPDTTPEQSPASTRAPSPEHGAPPSPVGSRILPLPQKRKRYVGKTKWQKGDCTYPKRSKLAVSGGRDNAERASDIHDAAPEPTDKSPHQQKVAKRAENAGRGRGKKESIVKRQKSKGQGSDLSVATLPTRTRQLRPRSRRPVYVF